MSARRIGPPTASFAATWKTPEAPRDAIVAIAPDLVIHAAGRTPPAEPGEFYRSNTLATLHLLDALRLLQRPTRVVLAGSAAELGPVEIAALPVVDDYPCRPLDAYGLSKWLATCAGMAARPPLEVIAARIFNPIGPGQPTSQAFGRFAAQLADPESGNLVVGDLDGRRDFVDVRDVARALIALAERGRAGLIYNVGTGGSHAVREGLDRLIQKAGRTERDARPIVVKVERERTPSNGPSDSRAAIERIVKHTGWRPEVTWEQSLDDLWYDAIGRRRLTLTG